MCCVFESGEVLPCVGDGGRDADPEYIIDETFIDEEVDVECWNDSFVLVDGNINVSPHVCGGWSYCGAYELEEVHVSPLEDVVGHNKHHNIDDSFQQEAVLQTVF